MAVIGTNAYGLAAHIGIADSGNDAVHRVGGNVDHAEAIEDADRTDIGTSKARLVGNGSNQVAGAQTDEPAAVDVQPSTSRGRAVVATATTPIEPTVTPVATTITVTAVAAPRPGLTPVTFRPRPRQLGVRNVLLIVRAAQGLVGDRDRRRSHSSRIAVHREVVDEIGEQIFGPAGNGVTDPLHQRAQPLRLNVLRGRQLLDHQSRAHVAFDVAQQTVLPRLHQTHRRAGSTGTTDPADAVHIHVRR